jgi:PEP-CTERM motif
MSMSGVARRSVVGLALAAGALFSSLPAHAIIAVGSWDPRYGSPFLAGVGGATSDMWWSGNALFTIPDTAACAATEANSYLVTCSGMTVSAANVFLSEGETGPQVDALTFPGSMSLGKVQFESDGVTVKWVESVWWDPLVSGSAPEYNLSNYFFSLAFFEDGSRLFHVDKTHGYLDAHGGHGPDDKVFFWNGSGDGHIGNLCGPTTAPSDGDLCGFSDRFGAMTFTTMVASVPEPGTGLLVLAALGAAGFSARQRMRRSL